MNRRGGLGRGLAALIPPGELGPGVRATLAEVPVDAVQPNPRQPREVFDDEELEGLAASIRDLGVLQPIVVRPLGEDTFELIAGERRLRAAKRAGIETIPAVVRATEDRALLKEALVENIHRVQLNPLEEAAAYQQLLDDFGFTQEELAASLGKSRPSISNTLRLLHLPEEVQRRVAAGVLTAGHAKALLALADDATMDRFATRTVTEGLSVRALEELVRLTLLQPADRDHSTTPRPRGLLSAPGLAELQDDLSDALATRVRIQSGARKGKLQIEFRSVDDLERLVGIIARGLDADEVVPDVPDDVHAGPSSGDPAPAPVVDAWPAADPADALGETDDGGGDGWEPITPDPLELDPTGRIVDELDDPGLDAQELDTPGIDPPELDEAELERLTRPD